MLPSKGLMRVLALLGYTMAILGTISTGSIYVGSKLAWASDIAAINKSVAGIVDSIKCSGYHQQMSNIETRETIQTNAKSQLDAMRQSNIKLTPAEISRYNDIVLDLGRLADKRRSLTGVEACR